MRKKKKKFFIFILKLFYILFVKYICKGIECILFFVILIYYLKDNLYKFFILVGFSEDYNF